MPDTRNPIPSRNLTPLQETSVHNETESMVYTVTFLSQRNFFGRSILVKRKSRETWHLAARSCGRCSKKMVWDTKTRRRLQHGGGRGQVAHVSLPMTLPALTSILQTFSRAMNSLHTGWEMGRVLLLHVYWHRCNNSILPRCWDSGEQKGFLMGGHCQKGGAASAGSAKEWWLYSSLVWPC